MQKANEILKDQAAILNQEHQGHTEKLKGLEVTEKETLDELSQTDSAIKDLEKTTNARLIESRNQLQEKQKTLQGRLNDVARERERIQGLQKESAAAIKELEGTAPKVANKA